MKLLELLLINLSVICMLMILLWLLSISIRDVSIIDIFWGMGFVVIAGVTIYHIETIATRAWLMLGLTSAWAIRLSLHLARRKIGTPEDHRYQAMRNRIGPNFWLVSLFTVFGLQAVIMMIVALPLLSGLLNDSPLTFIDAIGVLFWGTGFAFETVGDAQLARFKANPLNQGKVMDRGLWRYTRHPNYFGDFMVWWGLYLLSLGDGRDWWTVVSPVVMSILLMRVSGVTLLESTLRASKPGYAEYAGKTSAFFPWPPKR